MTGMDDDAKPRKKRAGAYHHGDLRDTLVQLGEQVCTTPEQFKAWSQNLGHERVMTTLTSYGTVASHRQAELIRGLATRAAEKTATADPALIAQVMAAMQVLASKGAG